MRRLNEGHLTFLDFKNSWNNWKKNDVCAYTTSILNGESIRATFLMHKV